MKKVILLLLMISTCVSFSQEILMEQDIQLKSIFKDKRESYPVLNEKNGKLILFLLDDKTITELRLNQKYIITNNFSIERPGKKYKILLGSSIVENQCYLLFTNENKNKILVKSINNAPNKDSEKLLAINFKDERFLEAIGFKNTTYILTVKRLSSLLKLHEVKGKEIVNSIEFDFSKFKFSEDTYPILSYILNQRTDPLRFTSDIYLVDNKNPNPLDITSELYKIYCYSDKIFISFDNYFDHTKLITIDLNDYTYSLKEYNHGKIECGDAYKKQSNSYLYDNNLYQIMVCRHELLLSVLDIEANSVLKEWRVNKTEDISFKNSDLVQKGSSISLLQNEEFELSTTKQFLRKITHSSPGVSIYKLPYVLEVTIGGYAEYSSNVGGIMMVSPGTSVSTPYGLISTPPVYHYNPTMYSYNRSKSSRSVYFKSLLDQSTFEHVDGEIQVNAFDRIEEYYDLVNDTSSVFTAETLFKVDDYYIYGYYHTTEKKYYLRKFED